VKVSGQVVNLAAVGKYQIKYNCKNLAGTPSATCVRTVFVKDMSCPSCLMNMGPSRIEASFPYFDSGAVCTDTLDGPTVATVTNPVNVESTGTYLVTYRSQDANKNWNDGNCKGSKAYIRTVVVVDTLAPVLSLRYRKSLIQLGKHDQISNTAIQYRNPISDKSFGGFGQLMSEMTVSAHSHVLIAAASGVLGLALLAVVAIRKRTQAAAL